ncbi:hypothetical protein A2U01_0078173, partial [Trifolium medium]|nr:hypothetical protein [Trifolium medium]
VRSSHERRKAEKDLTGREKVTNRAENVSGNRACAIGNSHDRKQSTRDSETLPLCSAAARTESNNTLGCVFTGGGEEEEGAAALLLIAQEGRR